MVYADVVELLAVSRRMRHFVIRNTLGVTVIALAASLTGSWQATASAVELHDPRGVGAPYDCPWSTHWQTGKCVTATTSDAYVGEGEYGKSISFNCPAKYAFPFLDAFSGNPVWKQTDLFAGWTVPKAVAMNNEKVEHLSYTGRGPNDRGWVTVDASALADRGRQVLVHGTYVCADKQAS